MALSPEEQAAWSQMTGKPYQSQSLMDYIPNVFGSVPAGFEGLLGAEQAQQISQRSNIAGLLGAAAALAQGMGSQGPRRSAIQNVLGALGAGYGTAGQVAQQGLQNIGLQYEIAQKQLSQGQTLQRQQAISQLLQTPEIANDPAMRAWVLNNPDKATEYFAQRNAMEAYRRSRMPKPQPAAPVAEAMPVPMPGEGLDITAPGQAIPPMVERAPVQQAQPVTQKTNELQEKIREAEIDAEYYSGIGNLDQAKKSQDIASNLRSRMMRESLVDQISTQADSVYPTLKKSMESLVRRAPNLTQEQINSEYNKIMQEDAKILENMDPTILAFEIRRREAMAPKINLPSESERTAGFLTNRLQGALSQLQTVTGQAPSAASPNIAAEAVRTITGSDYLKNLVNPETRQQVEAAQLELLDSALTLGTGAAYTREQLENYRKSYFPQLGDKPATIQDKAKRLQNLLEAARIKAGRAAPASTPPLDVNEAINQELNRRKGKK